MYRYANTISYGLRKLLSSGKVSNQVKAGVSSYPFHRKEYELFTERVFYWNAPTILTGPSRCGKTVLINQYLQKQPNWYIIKHDRQLVESCGMNIVKSFAVAFNNHLENLESVYKNPEVPKSNTDKWNINKYLLRTPKIKTSNTCPKYVFCKILDAITNQYDIYNGEKRFLILLDDFDSTHMKNEFEWTSQLLFNFSKLIGKEMLKTILLGKNPFSINHYIQMKTNYWLPVTISLGFLSKSDMMKYLQEKQLSLPICNKIFDCFGGDIDLVSKLLANKEKKITETDIENHYNSMIYSSLTSLKDVELSLSPEERNILRKIYTKVLIAGYISRSDYIKEFRDSILDKFIDINLLSAKSVWNISEDTDTLQYPSMITYPYPWYKHVAKEFLKQ